MLDFYTWTTPNGRKVSIMLEELGLDYEVHAIDIGAGDQKAAEFMAIAPSGKIPAIRDRETGMTLMESGAICLWLAETHGRFWPDDARWEVLEWSMYQMGQAGPYLGAAHQFLHYHPDESGEFGQARSRRQVDEVYSTLNRRLAERDFIAGSGRGEYTVADILTWPWIASFPHHQADLNAYTAVRDWYLRIADRPAVQRGYNVPKPAEIRRP